MYLTFDVECNGLFGETFAVGYVLTTNSGLPLFSDMHSCPKNEAEPDKRDPSPLLTIKFLEENVLPALPEPDCFTPRAVRDKFFAFWASAVDAAKKQGEDLRLVADCAYPCETRFLTQVRNDFLPDIPTNRHREFVVYPLFDVSTALLTRGYIPTQTFARLEAELPAHNPLNDARQSSRLWHALLKGERLPDPIS